VTHAEPRLAWAHASLRPGGGFERYARTVVAGLHARGVRPVFVARRIDRSMPETAWVDPVVLGDAAVPQPIVDHVFDWRLGRARRRLHLAPLIATSPTRHADVAVCGGTHPGYLRAMGEAAGWRDRARIALERAFYGRAGVVVAHSRRMRDELAADYGVEATVRVLHPPVDAARFSPVDADARRVLRARFGFPEDRLVLLLASTGHRRKGLPLLQRVLASTDLPVLLAVAGRPVEGRPDRIVALGHLEAIEDAYRAADATVLVSTYEPFGLVAVESVLCGTPVVLSPEVGAAEVLAPDARVDLAARDEASLAAALAALVARWRAGTLRLAAPRASLRYDPSVDAHVDALLDLAGPARNRGYTP
jgi:glycosyltransferase involved in cell wall biosynthesis